MNSAQASDGLGHGGEQSGEADRDGELGDDHVQPADRGGQQVDHAAVVDLRAEHAGADDQRGERQQDREAEVTEYGVRPGRAHGTRPTQYQRERDEDRRGDGEQHGAPAAERGADRNARDCRVEHFR
jgi:hypothetical protein